MPSSELKLTGHDALVYAAGECILSWSEVEFHLSFIFEQTLQSKRSVAHAVLGAVRSFEARLKMIHEAIAARFPDPDDPIRQDWKLLYNHCSALNQLRNQVAHATEVIDSGGDPWPVGVEALAPFMVLTVEKPTIKTEDIEARTRQFWELGSPLYWMQTQIRERIRPKRPYGIPVPDLVLRLRAEAAQRRAKHGRPPRSSKGSKKPRKK